MTALDRSSGALAANDHAAYELQKAATVAYLDQEASILMTGITLKHRLAAAWKATGFKLMISHHGMLYLYNYISRHGFPSAAKADLKRLGDSEADINALVAATLRQLSAPGSTFNFLDTVTDPAMDVADSRLAQADLATARGASKLPNLQAGRGPPRCHNRARLLWPLRPYGRWR